MRPNRIFLFSKINDRINKIEFMLKIYNTLTRKKEIFKPLKKNRVTFYHCGPTVYWTQHIGNLRGMTCGDIVVRVLHYLGYKVKHIRNYTDVGHLTSDEDLGEDKMEKAAKRDNLSPQKIAEKYIEIFENDTVELNLIEPTKKPRATEFIKEIIKMTQILINKNFAYTTDLAIYFDVSKAKNYTSLSGQKLEKNISGAGNAEISDVKKKHPADFVLWFFKAGAHKNALQYFSSPFNSPLVENGNGFPGWHIECSVMSKKYLGDTIDLHMGGIEHIPVHHTNEIAQSESANGVKFVNYWLHNEHLLVNNEKMAKSEGTSYSLMEIKEKGFNPIALRYFFLQAHYRSKLNFTFDSLEAAEKSLARLYDFICEVKEDAKNFNKTSRTKQTKKNGLKEFTDEFEKAIFDDLNLPKALSVVWELVNQYHKNKKDFNPPETLDLLYKFDTVLGLNLAKTKKQEIPHSIKQLVSERQQARQNKDWTKADLIRKQIEKMGYRVEDTNTETKITRIN